MIAESELFTQFGAGREGFWKEPAWLGVLNALAKHDGEPYTQKDNPALFVDIESEFRQRGITNLSAPGKDPSRSVFRAAPAAWRDTGVADFDEVVRVTDEGYQVLAGERTYAQCLKRLFVRYREARNGKNPFVPLLELMADGELHSFDSLFDAVQRSVSPRMAEWIAVADLRGFPYKVSRGDGNPKRSVDSMLDLLGVAGLAEKVDEHWQVVDRVALEAVLGEAKGELSGPRFVRSFDMRLIIDEIRRRGWQFADWQVAAYCHAVRTKPFVVLAGVSGTGKTKLPKLVAEATGAAFSAIQVRPDWRDSSDLLGYVDIGGRFRPGILLQAAREAMLQPGRQHFLLLDEMNLARVEYYFAEVLSLMEERRLGHFGQWRTEPLLSPNITVRAEDDKADLRWSEVFLPSNLAIIGSVNMDETTHPFSKKVLDRAFVIEFSDTDLAQVGSQGGQVKQVLNLTAADWQPSVIRLPDHPEAGGEIVQSVIDELVSMNRILSSNQLQVGYRLRDEVALFVLSLVDEENLVDLDGSAVSPLDLALCMKILPRVQGGGIRTRELLTNLDKWALGPGDTPRMPMCSQRIALLLERFEAEGFTSFWL